MTSPCQVSETCLIQAREEYAHRLSDHIALDSTRELFFDKYGDDITTRVFSLEYICEMYYYRWRWDAVYELHDVETFIKTDAMFKNNKQLIGMIMTYSPLFELSWISDRDIAWDYSNLSLTFVRMDLPFSYIEENLEEDWCYDILSYHPSLTSDIVNRLPAKNWCYITLLDKTICESDFDLHVCVMDKTISISIPSIFPLYIVKTIIHRMRGSTTHQLFTVQFYIIGSEEEVDNTLRINELGTDRVFMLDNHV